MFKGLAIGDFRSIGELQTLNPLGKINLFVGANNSGKSNILTFVNLNLSALLEKLRNSQSQHSLVSQPHLRRQQNTTARLCVRATLDDFSRVLKPQAHHTKMLVDKIHNKLAANDSLWFDEAWPSNDLANSILEWNEQGVWRDLWNNLTRQSGGSAEAHWVPETLLYLKQLLPEQMSVYAIPIDRHTNASEQGSLGTLAYIPFTGAGVIKLLASF